MKKIKVLVVPSDRTGVSYYRSITPHIALEANYPDLFHVDIDYNPDINNDDWLKQYDIIHYHRTLGPYEQMKEMNERLKKLSVISIMDLDDYWAPGSHHPAHLLIKNSGMDKKVEENLRNAQYITTTTSFFANEISKFNKHVYVIPNAIDIFEKQFISNPEPSKRLRIGWLGGSSHLKDLEILKGVVSKLKTDGLLDQVQFVLCGFDLRGTHTDIDPITKQQNVRQIKPKESVWYQYERIFTDDYQSISPEYKEHLLSFEQKEFPKIENEPYRRVWTKHISTYASNYNLFDVSLAPLQENLFNKVKSQLKVIEAGFHNKAIIAQNFGPYQIDLKNSLLFGGEFDETANSILVDTTKNHKDWYSAIKKLIKNPEMVKTLQKNLNKTVSELYSAEKVATKRKDLYLEIMKNK